MFDRDFKVLAEVYYKHLYNVIPYDIDNVRIRYFADNNARAYATGIDMRISGEFIPGAESWFSLGILRTREDIVGDSDTEGNEVGYIRRPSDQLINLGIFFQDHLPDDPLGARTLKRALWFRPALRSAEQFRSTVIF